MQQHDADTNLAQRTADSAVQLSCDDRTGIGFVASEDGLVVTNLHVVVGASHIKVRDHNGQESDVVSIAGVDPLRDLVLLRCDDVWKGRPTLPLSEGFAPEVGTVLKVKPESGASEELQEVTVRAVQRIGDGLTVFVLAPALPLEASGAALIDAQGRIAGVLTVARSPRGLVSIGIPTHYVRSLLDTPLNLPIDTLMPVGGERKQTVMREIPNHPVAVLTGIGRDELREIALTLAAAINIGAPAFNRGDVALCAQTYLATARQLREANEAHPLFCAVLDEGMSRAASEDDDEYKAWAMRDCFDGILAVISEVFEGGTMTERPSLEALPPLHSTKKYLN